MPSPGWERNSMATPRGMSTHNTVGPDVTRFDQLKVGDTIKATYVEYQ